MPSIRYKTGGLILFCVMSVILAATNHLFAMNWADIENTLRTQIGSGRAGIEQVTNQEFVKGLVRTGDPAILTERCFQRGKPLVITAGFLGVKELAPTQCYFLALRIAWDEDSVADLQIIV